jgi:hypothetical protein
MSGIVYFQRSRKEFKALKKVEKLIGYIFKSNFANLSI